MPSAQALRTGLEKHGHSVHIGYTLPDSEPYDVIVCWGWRTGRTFARHGKDILVMERSYMLDRFKYFSFGWNGLNGNASFYIPDVAPRPDRWDRMFSHLLKPRHGGCYALVCGQVHGDASLYDCPDTEDWYRKTFQHLQRAGHSVYFRDHPCAHRQWAPELPRSQASDLPEAMSAASVVVAWNSNSLVEAALSGASIYAGSPGCMAYPVSQPGAAFQEPKNFDIEKWARDLSWTQWTLDEVADGRAIPIILAGWGGASFGSRRGKYELRPSGESRVHENVGSLVAVRPGSEVAGGH